MSMEKPIAVAMIICDQIITEEGSHKKSLIGCFNNVGSTIFPTKPITCFIFVALTNGQGVHKIELKCINQDQSNSKVFGMAGPLPFENPLETVEMGFKLVNLTFPKPGMHVIELWCGSELLLERRFNVQELKKEL